MNIFGFLATIIVCGTVIGSIWLLAKKPISFRVIRANEFISMPPPEQPKVIEASDKKEEPKAKPEQPKENIISMDAVVKAANELMGVETLTQEDIDGR